MVEEFGSKDAAKKGGETRAANLTKTQRSDIAKQAAAARWHADVPRATHYGDMVIGSVAIPCAVLDDKTRVLTQRGFSVALGRHKNPKKNTVVELPVFLQASNLNSFIDDDLRRSSNPIRFKLPEGSTGGVDGSIAFGYRADLLPKVCDVYIQAKMAGFHHRGRIVYTLLYELTDKRSFLVNLDHEGNCPELEREDGRAIVITKPGDWFLFRGRRDLAGLATSGGRLHAELGARQSRRAPAQSVDAEAR